MYRNQGTYCGVKSASYESTRPPLNTLPAQSTPLTLSASSTDAVRKVLAEAASANTTRSYATALRYWAGWYAGRYGRPIEMPLDPSCVIQFVVDHLARHSGESMAWELPPVLDAALVTARFEQRRGALKLPTIVHRVAVLSSAHQLLKLANPCDTPEVRQSLAKARRAAHKRGERPNKMVVACGTEGHGLPYRYRRPSPLGLMVLDSDPRIRTVL